jgi:hypothetical protein
MVTYRIMGMDGRPRIFGNFESPSEMMRIVFFIFLNGLKPSVIEQIVDHAANHSVRKAGTVVIENLDDPHNTYEKI